MDTKTIENLAKFEAHYAESLKPYSGSLPQPEQRARFTLTMRDGQWSGQLLCLPGGLVWATMWRSEGVRASRAWITKDSENAMRVPIGYSMARALLCGGARAGLLRTTELLMWKGYQRGGLAWLMHAFPDADPFLCWCAGQAVLTGQFYNQFHVHGNLVGAGVGDFPALMVAWHAEVGDRLEELFRDTYWDVDAIVPDEAVAG